MTKLFKCKCHGLTYKLCACGKQYCTRYWALCPRCHH